MLHTLIDNVKSGLRTSQRNRISRQVEDDLKYADFLNFVDATARRSLAGENSLMPNDLWLRVSENCNLKCIGCWTEGLFRKVYLDVEEARKMLSTKGDFRQISLTSGEPFLHPKLCDILEICRETHPEAKIFVISNGNIPIKGRYADAVKLIDRLGLSVDGASKETYEKIRQGGVFDRFVENTREIMRIREETGFPREVCFSFTGNAVNLSELPALMKLAHDLGVPEVWAQPMEMKNDAIYERINKIHIDTMPADERRRLVDLAREEAKKYGIQFYHAAALYPPEAPSTQASGSRPKEKDAIREEIEADIITRMCLYPYSEPFQLSKDGDAFVLKPCCYMLAEDIPKLVERFGFKYETPPSAEEIYNSEGYWKFRRELAEGKLKDVCGSCAAAKTYLWKPPSVTP